MSKAKTQSDSGDNLPNREFGWEQTDSPFFEDDVPLFSPNVDKIETNRGSYSSLGGNQIGYVPVDADRFSEDYDTEELSVPKYYSHFDDLDTHVAAMDTGRGNTVAWGITPERLEDAIRVVTGGGRYRHSDLSVYTLDTERLFLVVYDGETWVASTTTLRSLPEDYDYDTTEVQGFTVPDDDAAVLRGLEWFLELLPEHYDEEIVAFDKLTGSGYYHFERDDGSTFSTKGSSLRKLGKCAHDPEEVQTDYEIETEYGEEYDVSWDEVTCEIGDYVGKIYGSNTEEKRQRKECVAGYQMRWEDPRTSSRVSMNGKIACKATYYYILYRENYDRYEVRDRDERIAEFEPENKDWSPF